MKIKLFDRAKCISIAKQIKLKSGMSQEEVDNISTSSLLHGSPDFIFSGNPYTVVHLQYDGEDNPKNSNFIGYNICVDRYGTSYYVDKEFVKEIDEVSIGDIEIVDSSKLSLYTRTN